MTLFTKFINSTYKTLFLNAEGKISLTKAGAQIGAIGVAIATFPASMAAVGITVALPAAAVLAAKYLTGLGTVLTIVGARNAADKTGTQITPVDPSTDKPS